MPVAASYPRAKAHLSRLMVLSRMFAPAVDFGTPSSPSALGLEGEVAFASETALAVSVCRKGGSTYTPEAARTAILHF